MLFWMNIKLFYAYFNMHSKSGKSCSMCIGIADWELVFIFYFTIRQCDMNRAAPAKFWMCCTYCRAAHATFLIHIALHWCLHGVTRSGGKMHQTGKLSIGTQLLFQLINGNTTRCCVMLLQYFQCAYIRKKCAESSVYSQCIQNKNSKFELF
jgi:hypothetical protein